MKFTKIKLNKFFSGRVNEQARLRTIASSRESSIIVIHGRRRVGKTELIEQTFADRNLLKFEGVEGKPVSEQKKRFLDLLAIYLEKPDLKKTSSNCSWLEIFEILAKDTTRKKVTIYLEELQWLACYQSDLISELKAVWDNQFRRNPKLLLILCGSSPSFFHTKVLRSKALYNRSMHEMHLLEFPIEMAHKFLGTKNLRETFNAYLSVGGIPEYLRLFKGGNSCYLALCQQSFLPDSFFLTEFEKIFVSSFSNSEVYRKIVLEIGQEKYLTRPQIIKRLHLSDSSGGVSERLLDLELSGFITKYTPAGSKENSKVVRYEIKDYYLSLYFKFIYPRIRSIRNGEYSRAITKPLPNPEYMKWLGNSFERFCRSNTARIAELLGFGSVDFSSGAEFYRGKSLNDQGFQIDLIFKRKDKVWSVCEIKYHRSPIDISIIEEVDAKIGKLKVPDNITLSRVLISASGASNAVADSGFFEKILTLEDLVD